MRTLYQVRHPLAAAVQLATEPRTRYYWSVTVRTNADEEVTGETNWFETAKQEEPWQAKWITCDNAESRHPCFARPCPVTMWSPRGCTSAGLGCMKPH